MTSDAGSLLYIGDSFFSKEKYVVTVYSEGYASPEHITSIKNCVPRTRDELIAEDKYQLIRTLNGLIRILSRNCSYQPSPSIQSL